MTKNQKLSFTEKIGYIVLSVAVYWFLTIILNMSFEIWMAIIMILFVVVTIIFSEEVL